MKDKKQLQGVKGKYFWIVCIEDYTIDDIKVSKGCIAEHCWGFPMPKHWRKAVGQELIIN